jgi:hypothetical protein
MADGEQRPTDDVEGHRRHFFEDPEAVEDDRSSRIPDDAEGHGLRLPPEAVDEGQAGDDAKGHGWHHAQSPEATDEDQGGDDTQGHSGHARV